MKSKFDGTPSPRERASSTAQYNGLVEWRRRQAEEKARKMADLAEHRKQATTEIRDGREFRVLHLPDRYDFTAPPLQPRVQLRGPKRRQAA